jgi:formiminotetrahydrofolate cyclodeaminase
VQEGRPTRFRDLSLDAFLERLSSSEPVPGGGSAAAIAAALGASLVAMVAALSQGRPKYTAHESVLASTQATALRLRDRFLAVADEDAEAYGAFAAALKLPRESDAEREARQREMSDAARRAAEKPLECVELCLELVTSAEALAGRSNVNASSDLVVAALLSEAAARGASANVMVNVPSIDEPEVAGELVARTKELVDEVERLASTTRQIILSGDARDPIAAAD